MSTRTLGPASAEETVVWYSLILTYPIYLMGSLYLLGSAVGWILAGIALLRWFVEGKSSHTYVSPTIWVWILGMIAMLVALLVAHFDWSLGMGQTIKSVIGWAKGWALLALFPLLGGVLSIRKELIIRGVCIVGLHSIIFGLIGLVLYLGGLSGGLFTSPLKFVGGPNEVFIVSLFGINPETGMGRWQFFTPWAPAAGLMSCLMLVIAMEEQDWRWRVIGAAGALVMCLLCQSRAGWIIFVFILPIAFGLSRLGNPLYWIMAGVAVPAIVLLGQPIIEGVLDFYQQVKESRPDSTRVRGALANIAVERWQNEAPIWGHGIVENGPKIVERMPIGTHHTWYGLLFVKGLVGLWALAIPLALSLLHTLWIAQKTEAGKVALAIILIMVLYSFFENLEILAYLYWPMLLWIGLSMNPKLDTQSSASEKSSVSLRHSGTATAMT